MDTMKEYLYHTENEVEYKPEISGHPLGYVNIPQGDNAQSNDGNYPELPFQHYSFCYKRNASQGLYQKDPAVYLDPIHLLNSPPSAADANYCSSVHYF